MRNRGDPADGLVQTEGDGQSDEHADGHGEQRVEGGVLHRPPEARALGERSKVVQAHPSRRGQQVPIGQADPQRGEDGSRREDRQAQDGGSQEEPGPAILPVQRAARVAGSLPRWQGSFRGALPSGGALYHGSAGDPHVSLIAVAVAMAPDASSAMAVVVRSRLLLCSQDLVKLSDDRIDRLTGGLVGCIEQVGVQLVLEDRAPFRVAHE